MQHYEKRQWQIREYPFRPYALPHTETIYTIGNGLVGVRGSFEEGYPDDNPTTLVAGIFNHKEGEFVPDLVSMPNWLTLRIQVNDEAFRLDRGKILGYERILNLRTGTHWRGVLWLSPRKDILRLAFERFTSLDNPHVLAIRVLVQVLNEGKHRIKVYSALDNTVTNPDNIDHWGHVALSTDGDKLFFAGQTDQSAYHVAMQAQTVVDGRDVQWTDCSEARIAAHTTGFMLLQNEKATITKYVALHTSRDSDDPFASCSETQLAAIQMGYDALKSAHDAAWARYWDAADIQIECDELAQRALRFCTYHVLVAVPTHEDRVSIGAKTLSGFGYKGHVFWDTELFMVPPLTLTMPHLARNLLMYRYHNLPGARAKAAEAGYRGAMYPWESADTGEETTPRWVYDTENDKRTRIWTGDNEQHISSDIAYSVLQFWNWTGDDDWFARYGAEIVLDTAVFWASRVEYNESAGRYELRTQIGPDEYHDNIDNSAFTNRLVAWHLQQAEKVWQWLTTHRPKDAERLAAALGIDDALCDRWRDIAIRMWIPHSEEGGGVLEQFEGFFDRLKPVNLEDYTPRTVNLDWIYGHDRIQNMRVIKQADIVMLMALLGDELGDEAFLNRNWEVYSRLVDHGSSLSPAIHAWVAARLGRIEEAYEYFIYGATIDLEDNKGNVRDGIHAASCGGVWQAVVFGFCGLHLTPKGPKVDPRLPSHWRSVRFKVMYKGEPYEFVMKGQGE